MNLTLLDQISQIILLAIIFFYMYRVTRCAITSIKEEDPTRFSACAFVLILLALLAGDVIFVPLLM